MALEQVSTYIFTPSITPSGGQQYAATLAIPGRWNIGQIRRIVNATRNKLMYSDENEKLIGTIAFSTYNQTVPTGMPSTLVQKAGGVTTFNLLMDTSYMAASDVLEILVQKKEQIIRPFDFGTDAIERIRVSDPKSMIDADFEYGLQPTKWASYGLNRYFPSILELQSNDLVVTAITADGTTTSSTNSLITVTTSVPHSIVAGSPIHVAGTSQTVALGAGGADGGFIVETLVNSTQFTYRAKTTVTSGSILADNIVLRRCVFATNVSIPVSSVSPLTPANGGTLTVTTSSPHNLVPGTPILVRVSGGASFPIQAVGSFYVVGVPTATTFTYAIRQWTSGNGGSTVDLTGATFTITTNSDGLAQPRPWDGGVQIYTASASHGASIIRTTKKYNRYQSGKGYLWSSGVLFRPNYDIRSITADATAIGSLVTVTVDGVPHGLQGTSLPALGARVTIAGVSTAGYNGTFTVNTVTSPYTFTYRNTVALGTTTGVSIPGTDPKVIVTEWSGAVVRAGPFDDQNGMFFEYDGATFWAVRRSAVFQLAGTLAINAGSTTVTGTATRFTQQTRVGDKIVIKGMTYLVSSIASDTSMTISPDYRPSTSASGVKGSIVRETRISQANWNIDTCDGSGGVNNPSGFQLDLNTMQMVGIQYTWYGAGFIDWMIRGADGNWVMVHRLKNNNVNYEAHMRTGNLPVRYSVENEGAYTYLTASLAAGATTATVASTADFPSTGVLLIDQEIISYSGKTSSPATFTGLTRAATLSKFQGGLLRSFTGSGDVIHNTPTPSATNGPGVVLIRNTCSPSLVHWGSALVMDGGFDTDRGYIFNYQRPNPAVPAPINLTTTTQTVFLIRLAPSVSAGLVGVLGNRDLINRAQFLLQAVGIAVDNGVNAGAVIVEGVVNPTNISAITWVDVNASAQGSQPSFAQVSTSWTGGTATGGEQIFAFAAPAPSGTSSQWGAVNDRLDLSPLKELTNSPIGGDGVYPDGPEVLAINVRLRNGTANGTVLLRWSEAQA
jgi:hypothetical protein